MLFETCRTSQGFKDAGIGADNLLVELNGIKPGKKSRRILKIQSISGKTELEAVFLGMDLNVRINIPLQLP